MQPITITTYRERFRRLIFPLLREKKMGRKLCEQFTARKYQDIIYSKYLLFYPNKENVYIAITREDFDSIVNGDELYLEIGEISGEVLALKTAERVFNNPEEFSFSDR